MEAEFASLDAKVTQLVALCERLRGDNAQLRQQLASAQHEIQRLNERIEGARARLEQILGRLPE